jgi:hypothetical protein
MEFDKEFLKALQSLSDKEKDKLILRLLRTNKVLARKLHFELVDTETVEDKREQMLAKIDAAIKKASEQFYSPGYLLMDVRDLSGDIGRHVKITKDKVGEIVLTTYLIRKLLELNLMRFDSIRMSKVYTLGSYIISKLFRVMILIRKQHEDFYLEFKEDIQAIGRLFGSSSALMKMAIHSGLDVNWLISFEIPEDIESIYKDLRASRQL